MRAIRFFPPDSRPSAVKLSIVNKYGERRMKEMLGSPEFQSYGYHYWDSPKATAGYGGHHYDGRYRNTVEKMINFYDLRPGDKVLEVGCGKGFLLVEFNKLGLEVLGVDISPYAVGHARENLGDRIICADVRDAKLPGRSFDFVMAKDTLPHLSEEDVEPVVQECMRLSRKFCFFEIEVARSKYEVKMMYRWDITHRTRKPPEWWLDLFKRVGYKGDYHFKVLIEDPSLSPLE